jgi:DNA-binding CsgD family transcriptional regulator/tetratricopeptide (TPR) repeat protein
MAKRTTRQPAALPPQDLPSSGCASHAALALVCSGRDRGCERLAVLPRNHNDAGYPPVPIVRTLVAPEPSSQLLERERELTALRTWMAAVGDERQGRLALVGGEAGVGKTALLRRFCDEQGDAARVLWGDCDALFTPRPLGPLLDVAQLTGGDLERLVESGAKPHEVADALMRELAAGSPTLVVLEDLHWADEATLDVVRLVGRRIATVRALIVATYREDELDRSHPLRLVLGEIGSGERVARLELQRLSADAVAVLAAVRSVDPHELYRKTSGNPFFVTEALAAPELAIPTTVRDAVLARASRLDEAARTVLDAVAVVPPRAEVWLLDRLAPEAVDRIEECVSSGILVAGPGWVAFRHELARLAVEESLPPNRRIALHREALGALIAPQGGVVDLARVAHHAEAAGDGAAVLRFAPAAAVQAASLGAHREAAAQYVRALRFAHALTPEAQAELYEGRSYQCFLTYRFDESIEAQGQALQCHREGGDVTRQGDALSTLAKLLWHTGRTAEAVARAREGVALLEQLAPGRALAMAYATVAYLRLNADDAEETRAWGERGFELAQRLGETEVLVHALNSLGTMEFLAGSADGKKKLERSLRLAKEARLDEQVARGLNNLAWAATRLRMYALADRYLEAGLDFYARGDLVLWPPYLLALRARAQLEQGRWADASETADLVVGNTRVAYALDRPFALTVLGIVRARRGDPGVWPVLDEALALVRGTAEVQRIVPVAAARAEALWLESRDEEVTDATQDAFALALRWRSAWEIGELACWRRRAGSREGIPAGAAEPYALQLHGEWPRAAELWTQIGCPYEAALASADADDDDALHRALAELHRLGARPAAAIVARRLHERGARGVARGPRRSTKANPADLTTRELEVLALVAQGLRNADIAERLFLSKKTVAHHVSAILRKLDVPSRGQAGAKALQLGIVDQDR